MSITGAQLQAQLGTDPAGPRVLMQLAPFTGTTQHWVVQGGAKYPGVTKMITTTASDTAATQAATTTTKLTKGSSGHD